MRILLFQKSSFHYREEFFKKLNFSLGNDLELFIADKTRYYEIFGLFWFSRFFRSVGAFDILVIEGNIRYLQILILPFLFPQKKIVYWGFWPTGKVQDLIKKVLLSRKNVFSIYYAASHQEFFKTENNFRRSIVANNTIGVSTDIYMRKRPSSILKLIIVGTLNARKGISHFIEDVFLPLSVYRRVKLSIVGDGLELENLKVLVDKLNLDKEVVFEGRLSDGEELRTLYQQSHICICYKQAGLSVLQSMGYSTPVFALTDAISGGEIENIINGFNGLRANDQLEMLTVLKHIDMNEIKLLSRNSFDHYRSNDIDAMCEAFKSILI